jgi:Ribonuclease G/E
MSESPTPERVREIAETYMGASPVSLYNADGERVDITEEEIEYLARQVIALRETLVIAEQRAVMAEALCVDYQGLREIAEQAVNELLVAYEEGYDDACDPAWSEKQLRRHGIKTESHTAVATDWFRGRSETAGKHASLRARLDALGGG